LVVTQQFGTVKTLIFFFKKLP